MSRKAARPSSRRTAVDFTILPQPDDSTCGPTCLHSVYRFFGDDVPLERIISETTRLPSGGTHAVMLACHALRRGYKATIYTFNLQLFDPTWFQEGVSLPDKLREQAAHKTDERVRFATLGYLEFLQLGGEVRFQDLTTNLLRTHLRRGVPIMTGLSATYLYRESREYGPSDIEDDVRGEPSGHFVVVKGYEKRGRRVEVADPLEQRTGFESHSYEVTLERLVGAILLGVLTHDANLLVVEPQLPKDAPARLAGAVNGCE